MSLMKCPECGKEISSLAQQCPHCGCPADTWENETDQEPNLNDPLANATDNTTSVQKSTPDDCSKGTHDYSRIIAIAVFAIPLIALLIFFPKTCNKQSNSTNVTELDSAIVNFTTKAAEQYIAEMEHKRFIDDSIHRVEFEAATKHYKSLFTEKKDEFSNSIWVTPKSAPRYRNSNGIYCYFDKSDLHASNFRFVFQYTADDWLFIDNLVFNIDGTNRTIRPTKWQRDNNSDIWEWCDEHVIKNVDEGYYGIDEKLIKDLASATSVKIKLNGSQYYDTRTLTSAQIKAIKDAYEYYQALGGTFQ